MSRRLRSVAIALNRRGQILDSILARAARASWARLRIMKRSLVRNVIMLIRPSAELAGFGLLVWAAWQVHPIAGTVGGGLVLLAYGNAKGRR